MPEIKIACYVNDVLTWKPFSGNSVKTGSVFTELKDNDMIFYQGRWWPFNAEMLMWFVDIKVESDHNQKYNQVKLSDVINLTDITFEVFGGGVDKDLDPKLNNIQMQFEKYKQQNTSFKLDEINNNPNPTDPTEIKNVISNAGSDLISN